MKIQKLKKKTNFKILLEVDQKYDEVYFNEEIVKKGEKLPKKVKESIKQGNLIIKKLENEKNFSSFINDCIIIENDIKDINNINSNIDKCNNINFKCNFIPLENDKDFSRFVNEIKKFGYLCYHSDDEKKEEKSDKSRLKFDSDNEESLKSFSKSISKSGSDNEERD